MGKAPDGWCSLAVCDAGDRALYVPHDGTVSHGGAKTRLARALFPVTMTLSKHSVSLAKDNGRIDIFADARDDEISFP